MVPVSVSLYKGSHKNCFGKNNAMKAAVLEKPGKLLVKEIPDPVIGRYDVLCKTLATATCSGTDNHIVRNHPYFKVKFPTIIGHEGIGEVVGCGSKVRNFTIGDIITRIRNKLPANSEYSIMYGAFAEKSIATDWQAMRKDGLDSKKWLHYTIHRVLPDSFDPIASTMIITWRETYSFLKKILNKSDKNVLIIGSGANALAFAEHARNLGLQSITIGSLKRSDSFLKAGADYVISYHQNIHEKLNTIKKKMKRFDIILDTIGNSNNLNQVISLLKERGKIGIYGLDSFLEYKIDFTKAPEIFTCYNGEMYDEGSVHDDIIEYIKAGKLNAWDYISEKHFYSLDKINEALKANRDRKIMKSVIVFK